MKLRCLFPWCFKTKPRDIALDNIDKIIEDVHEDAEKNTSVIDAVIDSCIELSEDFKNSVQETLEKVDNVLSDISNAADATATEIIQEITEEKHVEYEKIE